MSQSSRKSLARLGVFSVVMITVGSVDSIRNLPTAALFGAHLVVFYLLSAAMFLLPAAFVSAELSAIHDRESGIYMWVRSAFGRSAAWMAIWFQWIENVIWYPAILSFVAGSMAYVIHPSLVHNSWYMLVTVLASFWLVTLINCFGVKVSARFAAIGTIIGLLIPFTIIIGLGAAWCIANHPLAIDLSDAWRWGSLSHASSWVAITGIMLSFGGIEIATVHSGDVKNPKRTYPIALAISVFILLFTLIFGSLSVAIVVPVHQLSLVAGILQAAELCFKFYHLEWLLPILASLIVVGALGEVNNWIIAPARGLLQAAESQVLPQVFCQTNRHGAPVPILIAQAIIVSAVALVFVVFPSVNESYWFLTALASQLYMFMYIFMFLALLRLRMKSKSLSPNGYRIPGGSAGLYLCTALGCFSCVFTIFIGFIPPRTFLGHGSMHYTVVLVVGLLAMIALPLVLYVFGSRSERQPNDYKVK